MTKATISLSILHLRVLNPTHKLNTDLHSFTVAGVHNYDHPPQKVGLTLKAKRLDLPPQDVGDQGSWVAQVPSPNGGEGQRCHVKLLCFFQTELDDGNKILTEAKDTKDGTGQKNKLVGSPRIACRRTL